MGDFKGQQTPLHLAAMNGLARIIITMLIFVIKIIIIIFVIRIIINFTPGL